MLAEESVVCLQKALIHLREIWELIGIPEEQRLQRTEVVKKHIKVRSGAGLCAVTRRWGAAALFETADTLIFGDG